MKGLKLCEEGGEIVQIFVILRGFERWQQQLNLFQYK